MGRGARVSDKRNLLFIAFDDEFFCQPAKLRCTYKSTASQGYHDVHLREVVIRLLQQLATLAISTVLLGVAVTVPVLLPAAQCNLRTVQTCLLALGEWTSATEYRGGLFDVESRVVGGEFFGSSFLIRSF